MEMKSREKICIESKAALKDTIGLGNSAAWILKPRREENIGYLAYSRKELELSLST